MIKRNILKIAVAVLVLFSTTGCTEWLDLKPESEIILDEYWQSESDVQAVLASSYRGLTEEAVIYRMIVWGELRSDNFISGSGFPNVRYDMQRILDGDILATNGYCSWGSFYSVINYCNTLLHYAPKVLDRDFNFTQADLERVRAEARALRALSYFYLVRTFRDVPWIEEASITDSQDYKRPKESEKVIIGRIIEDLLYAQKYAQTDFGRPDYNKGRITLDAVNTILADVYLWNEEYAKCIEVSNRVLANKKLKLVAPALMFSQVYYSGNSTESIFELQFSDNVVANNAVKELYGKPGEVTGELAFPATLAYDVTDKKAGVYSPFVYKVTGNIIESEDDLRAKISYRTFGGKNYIFKYAGINRMENLDGSSNYFYRNNTSNWIVYRLSDLMLMKAEALTQLNGGENLKEAVSIVNETYLRSNEGQDSIRFTDYNSKAEVEKLVLRERQRELLFEGKRWFDLMRIARREQSVSTLNDYVDHKSSGASTSLGVPTMDALYLPISRFEIESNPNLKQNPYYEESNSSSSR